MDNISVEQAKKMKNYMQNFAESCETAAKSFSNAMDKMSINETCDEEVTRGKKSNGTMDRQQAFGKMFKNKGGRKC